MSDDYDTRRICLAFGKRRVQMGGAVGSIDDRAAGPEYRYLAVNMREMPLEGVPFGSF